MGKPYSQDLRERVIAAVDTGTGAYVAAPLFQVSVSYIYKALIRRRKTGEVTARPSGGGPKPKLAPHDDAVDNTVNGTLRFAGIVDKGRVLADVVTLDEFLYVED